jgi:hypothetical protein
MNVFGILVSITVDRHAGACCISSQTCVHDTQRSVGIKNVEQDLVDARALLDLANKRNNDTRPSGRKVHAFAKVFIWTVCHVAPLVMI